MTEIRPGQVWKRIRGRNPGTLIRIESPRYASGRPSPDDWHWVGVTNPKRRGMSYGSYIRRDYVLVTEPSKETS